MKTRRRPPSSSLGRTALVWTIVVVAALCAEIAGAAAAAPPDPNETCLACHGDKDAKRAAGTSIAVDAATFAQSIHGAAHLDCVACHADVSPKKLPHAEKLAPVVCANCHDKAAKEYSATVHGIARNGGNNVAATCSNCHGTHDIKPAKDAGSRTNHANLEATCGKCHGSDAVVAKAKLPGGNIVTQFHDSIHGKALTGAAAPSAPTCTNCHGAHTIRAKSDPASATNRARIPDTCGTCHQKERAQFATSQHGKMRLEGNLGAPGCNDCHSAHSIQQHTVASFQTEVIKECGNCHSDYLATYRDTFHGQVTALGYARMATCASCHGSHEILPASDPASTVSMQNRVKTCQQCHAGATANLASFDPHASRHDRAGNPLYYFAALFMKWLLIGVISFFGLHTLLWLWRSLRTRFARSSDRGNPRE